MLTHLTNSEPRKKAQYSLARVVVCSVASKVDSKFHSQVGFLFVRNGIMPACVLVANAAHDSINSLRLSNKSVRL